MGAIDLVVQIEAPPSVAAGIQRVGRSGRGIDLASRGVLFPKYRGDLLACAAATGAMRRGAVEALRAPRNPLDLLAQQIVAVVSRETLGVDELFALVRGAAPYAQLPRESFEGVLDMLAGRYPSEQFGELRPRIVWDRIAQTVGPRRGSQRLAVLNGGTIPDRGLYGVHLAGDGPDGSGGSRVGELDEEMVFETQAGDVFLLGASSWRVLEITKDRVLVAPAPGEPGKMPFWRGEGPGRSLEFGRAIGRLTRELLALGAAAAEQVLRTEHGLDARAATNLRAYLQEQQEATGAAPSDRTLVVESCLDEIGDWRVCLMSPFGARVHAPWALAIAARLRREGMDEVDVHWTDDGIVLRLPETLEPPRPEQLLPEADEAEDAVARELGGSSQFAARFRENAARALLLPRRQLQRRTPLWLQRRKAADLLAVAAGFPDFPILLETYRECLRDVFDLPGLAEVLREIEQQTIRVVAVQTSSPSPFAASLLFHYAGNYIYQGDAPLAERRAQALTLDHAQLKLLLGESELRQLLAPEALAEVEDQRQRRNATLRSLDDLHDLLLALGDLTRDEIAARLAAEVDREECDAWITRLQRTARAIEVRIAGETRLAAAEDAARYRDALGVNLPLGLPAALLEPAEKPLWQLVARYARTHGPFAADAVARRFGLGTGPVLDVLRQLEASGRAARGAFSPQGSGDEWCDAEVLREIKRRSLARLRKQVEAVPQRQFAKFLPRWQRADRSGRGCDAVLDAVEQLQGAPLGVSDLETAILPARIRDYRPEMLDQLLLAGEIVWQGCESLGPRDGRVALFLADRQPLLDVRQVESAAAVLADDAQAAQLHDALATRGALRFPQIAEIVGGFPPDVLAALWRLVWAGLVTNDTLAPLRSACGDAPAARSAPRRQRSRRPQFRSRRQRVLPGSEGRWTLLPPLDGAQASATERLCAWAGQLVLRYGVVTRELLARETPRGGFAAVYPVLKAMEEAGRLRRGYFVEGLGGLQFAQPGAEQLLRVPPAKSGDAPLLLAAADPANPYGAALPWPAAPASEARPKRAAGARVLLAEGELLAYLSPSGRDLATFVDPDGDAARLLADALADAAGGDAACLLQRIDGRSPADSPWLAALQQAGFQLTSRGLRRLRTPWPAERAADDDADG
jgi:ATP-dependent Lhr-like helicase